MTRSFKLSISLAKCFLILKLQPFPALYSHTFPLLSSPYKYILPSRPKHPHWQPLKHIGVFPHSNKHIKLQTTMLSSSLQRLLLQVQGSKPIQNHSQKGNM
eukprot:Phypoly_transcript_08223.p2 GENE.Phypoly_transcript_08223~~Phypoly_transcript_08223.p2  ORF type:complete len:101 (-),score=18.73 Phypoly_transcript_08223:892-1194(-)